MIRDITLGQYYNEDSIIHFLDPRTKINAVIIYLIAIFLADKYVSYGLAFLFLMFCIKLSKIPIIFITRGLKSLIFLLLLSVVFNLFMTPGNVIFKFGILSITYEGLNLTIKMALRLVVIVLFSSLLTLTTTPMELTNGIEMNLKFLKRFKLPISDIALMMSIALRFVPILIEEVDKIMKAQMSRGASFYDNNIIKRAKSYVPLLVPIFVSAFRRSNDLALAMEARCYNDSDNRTKLNPLHYKKNDFIAYAFLLMYFIILVILKVVF